MAAQLETLDKDVAWQKKKSKRQIHPPPAPQSGRHVERHTINQRTKALTGNINSDMHRMWTIILWRAVAHTVLLTKGLSTDRVAQAEGESADGTTWLCAGLIAARGEEWFIRLCLHQTTFLWLRVSHRATGLSGVERARQAAPQRDKLASWLPHKWTFQTLQRALLQCRLQNALYTHIYQWTYTWECACSHWGSSFSFIHITRLKHTYAGAKIKTYWAGLDIRSDNNKRMWWMWADHCLTCLRKP